MPFTFTDTTAHRHRPGRVFLGLDRYNREIGMATERGMLTIAGARSGKGAAIISTNLMRWTHNVLCIDPKGEAAANTWEAREAMGQTVRVLDPFKVAKVPDRLRASCDLLQLIDKDSLTAREDARVIADGLVVRHNPKNAEWYDRQVDLLAGIIGFVKSTGAADMQTLLDVRQVLTMHPKDLEGIFTQMIAIRDCGGVCVAGGNVGLDALRAVGGSSPEASAISGARTHTQWIDSAGMTSLLGGSTFDLSELKTGATSVFLVLPPKYLKEHGSFLRVFVRAALETMMAELDGGRCLFLLDEFYSLGRVDQIITAVGQLPGYGVHLWPILQDLGQLLELYGPNGSHSFFGNSDAHIFFANSDAPTLDYISSRLGRITINDIKVKPPTQSVNSRESQRVYANTPPTPPPPPSGPNQYTGNAEHNYYHSEVQSRAQVRTLIEIEDRELQRQDANAMRDYQHALAARGDPRLWPDEIRELVGKKDGDKVARSMIVFGKGGDVFNLRLAPYYEEILDELPTSREVFLSDELKHDKAIITANLRNLELTFDNRDKAIKTKVLEPLDYAFAVSIAVLFHIFTPAIFDRSADYRISFCAGLAGLIAEYVRATISKKNFLKDADRRIAIYSGAIQDAYRRIIYRGQELTPEEMEPLNKWPQRWETLKQEAFERKQADLRAGTYKIFPDEIAN